MGEAEVGSKNKQQAEADPVEVVAVDVATAIAFDFGRSVRAQAIANLYEKDVFANCNDPVHRNDYP